MADEPIDDADAETPDTDSSDVKVSASESADSSIDDAQVVEAMVVQPRVRKSIPPWVIVVAVGLLVVGGALYAYDGSVREDEASAFTDANERDTVEGWDEYLSWSEDQGFWANMRTPLERHASYARERREVRRAYIATENEDWPTLCGMIDTLDEAAPGRAAAIRGARTRIGRLSMGMNNTLIRARVPDVLAGPVNAAFSELAQNSVCGATAQVRYHVSAQSVLPEHEAIRTAALAEVDVSLQPVVQELSTRAVLFEFALSEANPAEDLTEDPVLLRYNTRIEFVAGETIRLTDGSTFMVPAMTVDVRVHGPTTEAAATQIRYTLPSSFAVEVFAQSRAGKSAEELSALAAQRLVAHLPARLRQVSGLTAFRADGGIAAYSRCRGMEVINRSMVTRADTAQDGTDRIAFSCEDEEVPYYEGCCEEENLLGRPEVGYRLMVNEPALVSLSANGDYGPIVGIFGECGPRSMELTCSDRGTVRALLEPGVYTAYVGGMADEDAGPYQLLTSIQPVSEIPVACAAVTRELQPGVAVSGNTTRASDNFAGACGGAGVGEDTYRLSITERSRVRCTVDGFEQPVLHVRSDCEDFESEVECAVLGSLRVIAEPGTLFVSVDGQTPRSKGDYELVCNVEPVPPALSGNLCAMATSVELSGETTSLMVDLLSAPEPTDSLCTGSGGPEMLYQFTLEEDSYVEATTVRPMMLALLDECTRGACSYSFPRRLSAGTHYLVVRGSRNTDFAHKEVSLRVRPVAPICEVAVLLRAGTTGGALSARNTPSVFDADCSSSPLMREAIFRVRATHPMHIRLRSEGVALSIHEGCGGRSLTCAPTNVGSVEARLQPGEYSVLVRGAGPGQAFQLETEIERL